MNAITAPNELIHARATANTETRLRERARTWTRLALWTLTAACVFYAAYASVYTAFLIELYLFSLLQLAKAPTWRKAFYPGLAVGLLLAATHLDFFATIFGAGAVALWLVFAVWIGLFVALARLCLLRIQPTKVFGIPISWNWLLIPVIWCGLEYFRSELYFLRFAWLSPGYAFGEMPGVVPFKLLGTYGAGFVLMSFACGAAWFWPERKARALLLLLIGAGGLWLGALATNSPSGRISYRLHVAGVQLEFPTQKRVLGCLTKLAQEHPEAELLVLSEYTFTEAPPGKVRDWCREHRKYLIVGGHDPAPGGGFYNTAFVISPAGEIVFRQAKSVPIQFFKDGLPAPRQEVWESPWGKLGICICYDLSYTRVIDRLVRMGAEAIIVPTMDVADWGKRQHELHARIAPVRAAECGLPIFRLASSGISQAVTASGQVVATATCPGDGAVISAVLELRGKGSLPLDRWLAPCSTGLTAVAGLVLLVGPRRKRLAPTREERSPGKPLA